MIRSTSGFSITPAYSTRWPSNRTTPDRPLPGSMARTIIAAPSHIGRLVETAAPVVGLDALVAVALMRRQEQFDCQHGGSVVGDDPQHVGVLDHSGVQHALAVESNHTG